MPHPLREHFMVDEEGKKWNVAEAAGNSLLLEKSGLVAVCVFNID